MVSEYDSDNASPGGGRENEGLDSSIWTLHVPFCQLLDLHHS
jgi:hypothetical protein